MRWGQTESRAHQRRQQLRNHPLTTTRREALALPVVVGVLDMVRGIVPTLCPAGASSRLCLRRYRCWHCFLPLPFEFLVEFRRDEPRRGVQEPLVTSLRSQVKNKTKIEARVV